MNRKFISVVTVSAMLCSFIMPTAIVSADEKNIYSNDFSHESDIEGFSLYDDTNTEGNVSITDDGRLSASMGNDWNDDNGIKKDITSALSGTENGDTLKISMDFASTYWNTATIAKAKLFLEVINGSETRQITIYEGPESVAANDETVTLSGETDSFEYKSGETVYLCVTQPSGMCYVDNISIEKYAADNTAVLFSYSGSSFEGQEFNSIISPYDSSDESWKCGAENGQLTLYEMNSTSWQNGFRIDVTDYIKQYETDTVYSASVRMKSTYWDKKDNGTIGCPAALFLEKNDGTRYPMADAPQQASEVDSDDWAEIAGEAGSIELADNETIYLCMTQTAQCQYITQIEFSVNGSVKEGVTAKPTETVSSEPTASATAESTREPEDGTLFYDTFENGTDDSYSVYDSTDRAAQITVGEALEASFGSDWSEKNGIKKNITSYVTSGSKYEINADVFSSWWGGVPAKVFFEIISEDGSKKAVNIAESIGDGDSGNVTVHAEADLRFADSDTVYLCITQCAEYNSYDNIMMKYIGDADPEPTDAPTETPPQESTPEPTAEPTAEPTRKSLFYDIFDDETDTDSYSIYDINNTEYSLSIENEALSAALGDNHGWDSSNGIRRDITDIVKQYTSGVTFGASAQITSYYWGDANAEMFFETVGATGNVIRTAIAGGLPENGDTAALSGSAMLSCTDSDRVYLCITHSSGTHIYDNISMWLENPYSDGVVPLTSGKRYAGTYFPEIANVILKHSFGANADEEMGRYSVFSGTLDSDPYVSEGSVMFQFAEDSTTIHGMELDVTDVLDEYLPDGGTARISYKIKPWWWWGNATLRLVVGDERTKLVSELPANESTTEFTLISAETDITRTKGETTKIIIGMDSASATGLAFDDVAIELPYSSLRVRDIAVSSVDQLDDIDTVSIVYGDSFISETGVEWNITDDNAHVVYGTTDIDGVTARAVITGSGITVNVVSDGVTKTETELEYGKAVTLSSGSKLAFMIDDETHLNLISAAAGDKQPAKTSDVTAAMRVIDNGNGITIEGIIKECAGDDEVILIYDKNGNIVNAVYAELSADGSYSVTAGLPADGEYKAVMTDTLAAFEFAYAGVQSFEELRAKISSGVSLSTLFDTGADAADNRIILGASGFAMLDKLSASDKSDVYTLFKNELGNKSRAEAAALFDALVTVKAADSAVSVSEWSVMLENSSEALGIKDTNVYNMYAEMSDTDKKSVKSKTDSQNLVSAEEFAKAFAGSVINTALLNAGYYTNIQQILKDNAEWFGINVSSVSSAAAKYILNNVNAGQTSIDSLTKLINTAISNSSSSAVSGGGGGGGSSSGGGSGISGTNLGPYTAQSANTDTTAADSASTVPSNRFNDLSGYDWAENAIYGLFDRDIVDGYGDGTFRPAGNVTREAFVKLIVTAFGVDAAEETKEFSDVTADRWSHDYIQRAAAAGIVTGVTDDSFMSEADITRQDAAVMIYRALLYKGKNLSAGELTFTDRADISEYAADAVAALSGLGIINGMDDGNFSPRNMTSRAQAAVMIYRVISTLF